MTIKCVYCGRFISYADMETGEALFYFEPDSDRGSERNEWTCKRCVLPPRDSGSRAEHEDSRSEAEPEGRQSGRSDSEGIAQPNPGATHD
jgi:hypothetical protein